MSSPHLKFIVAPPPAPPKAIRGLEEAISYRIPAQYRDFLSQQDGGVPEPNQLIGPNVPTGLVSVDEFLSVQSDAVESIRQVLEAYESRLPDWAIPIANCAGGNVLLVSVRSIDQGQIYFWDHELELTGEGPTWLAEDFGAFARNLLPLAGVGGEGDPKVVSVWVSPDMRPPRAH